MRAVPLPLLAGMLVAFCLTAAVHGDEDGFQDLFDGKTLNGWKGDPKFWSVQDGAITGINTKENPTKGNTFCVYQKEKPGDFELVFEYRIEGNNSGFQFRSFQAGDGPYRIGGYQADIDAQKNWAGTLYGERFRGILAKRGERAVMKSPKDRKVESLGDSKELAKHIKSYPEWNTFKVVAKGYVFKQYINGKLMSEFHDEDTANRRDSGLLAVQLHAGPPMKVQFRRVRLKKLD